MTDPLFKSQELNEQGFKKAQEIGSLFDELLKGLSERCPASREFSIVKTKLEEACFFAKKAMAQHPENQDQPPEKGWDERELHVHCQSCGETLSGISRIDRQLIELGLDAEKEHQRTAHHALQQHQQICRRQATTR